MVNYYNSLDYGVSYESIAHCSYYDPMVMAYHIVHVIVLLDLSGSYALLWITGALRFI